MSIPILDTIRDWWAVRRPQISTKIGAALTAISTLGPQLAAQFGTALPQTAQYCAVAGAVAGALLIVWNEKAPAP
jgi:hypothetical protein